MRTLLADLWNNFKLLETRAEYLTKLEQRMHRNKVIVALANKIARVTWKTLVKPEEIYRWAGV